MNANGWRNIPRELFYWITFLTKALPLRSIGTFIELLIGAMVTPRGFVTESYLFLQMQNHWTSYYKWLQRGKWSWLALSRQFIRLYLLLHKDKVVRLAIDDTLTLRASKKAPGSQVHHQHGNKPNLANYVRGQCWVNIAAVMGKQASGVAIPLLTRLIPSAGNTGKLVAAQVIMRAITPLFKGRTLQLLLDSWYMRRTLILPMVAQGIQVIGQARIDTRLYDEPKRTKKKMRGRPAKYGRIYTSKRISHLQKTEVTLSIHGKEQIVRYRSKVVMARFLDGLLVRAVWCEYKSDNGRWKKASLLLSTNTSLTAKQVIENYSLRWSIEPMFNQLKQAWGLKEAWQQSRQTLHRWVHLTMSGYGLIQLLDIYSDKNSHELCQSTPWRKGKPITTGRIRNELATNLRQVMVRAWWDKTCKKFCPPGQHLNAEEWEYWLKAN